MGTKSFSVQYNICVYENGSENCLQEFQQTVDGYKSVEALKDDIDSRIREMMRKNGINNASLRLEMVISDPDGEYFDSDTLDLQYIDGAVIFEP